MGKHFPDTTPCPHSALLQGNSPKGTSPRAGLLRGEITPQCSQLIACRQGRGAGSGLVLQGCRGGGRRQGWHCLAVFTPPYLALLLEGTMTWSNPCLQWTERKNGTDVGQRYSAFGKLPRVHGHRGGRKHQPHPETPQHLLPYSPNPHSPMAGGSSIPSQGWGAAGDGHSSHSVQHTASGYLVS